MINQSVVLTKISDVVTDISSKVTDINHPGTSITLDTTDAIFIGTPLPFNAIYLRLELVPPPEEPPEEPAPYSDAAVLNVSFYDSTIFRDFLSVQDGTEVLTQSGIIQLIVKDEYMPCSHDSKYLADIDVDGYYDLYWTKITATAETSEFNLQYVGQLFLDSDNALYLEYPDLKFDQYKKAFSATKADFLDQRIIATDRTISELIAKNVVSHPQQFMDWRVMKEATMHKTAELIYKSLGVKYKEDAIAANKSFVAALDVKKFGLGELTKSRRQTEKTATGFYR